MSGCLEIVSTGLTLDESFSGFEQLQGIDNNTHIESGPTSIYLKPTKLDLLIHTRYTLYGYDHRVWALVWNNKRGKISIVDICIVMFFIVVSF